MTASWWAAAAKRGPMLFPQKALPPAVRVPPPVEVCASVPADVGPPGGDVLSLPINARHHPPLRVREI